MRYVDYIYSWLGFVAKRAFGRHIFAQFWWLEAQKHLGIVFYVLWEGINKMPKIDTLDALEEHEEHDDDYQTITNWNANW